MMNAVRAQEIAFLCPRYRAGVVSVPGEGCTRATGGFLYLDIGLASSPAEGQARRGVRSEVSMPSVSGWSLRPTRYSRSPARSSRFLCLRFRAELCDFDAPASVLFVLKGFYALGFGLGFATTPSSWCRTRLQSCGFYALGFRAGLGDRRGVHLGRPGDQLRVSMSSVSGWALRPTDSTDRTRFYAVDIRLALSPRPDRTIPTRTSSGFYALDIGWRCHVWHGRRVSAWVVGFYALDIGLALSRMCDFGLAELWEYEALRAHRRSAAFLISLWTCQGADLGSELRASAPWGQGEDLGARVLNVLVFPASHHGRLSAHVLCLPTNRCEGGLPW
jgi:hypothetical protein